MKIVALVRTLNEQRNIADFCAAYDWTDMVLVADGGSEDDTVFIAEQFPNVWVREFDVEIHYPSGYVENPHGRHFNFLSDWAREEEAEWVIFDDCDCRPNPILAQQARVLIEETDRRCIMVPRLHIWGTEEYLPKMTSGPSLWAWKLDDQCTIRGTDKLYGLELENIPDDCLELSEPFCLLHYSYPDEETVQAKIAWYKGVGRNLVHPLEGIYAPPQPLPEWVFDDVANATS